MKLRYFVLSISVAFFMVSLLSAQAVQPASLTIEAIPGDTSPQQKVQIQQYMAHQQAASTGTTASK